MTRTSSEADYGAVHGEAGAAAAAEAEAAPAHAQRAPPESLDELIDRLGEAAGGHDDTSLGMLFETVGTRSFGPLLLLVGLILVTPISGIPGVPTLVGAIVMLISVQLLVGKRHFWLPQWIQRRRVPGTTLCAALQRMRRPARFVDRILRPRLAVLADGPALYGVAVVCASMAAVLPPLELLPFAASVAGAALAAFGLALISRDGLLVLIALLIVGGGVLAFGELV